MVQRAKRKSRRLLGKVGTSLSMVFSLMALALTLSLSSAIDVLMPRKGTKVTAAPKCSCNFYPQKEGEKKKQKHKNEHFLYWRLHGKLFVSPVKDGIQYVPVKKCKKCGGKLPE